MKRLLLYGLILTVLTGWHQISGQTLQGSVGDRKNDTILAGANIYLEHTPLGTSSDEQGHYRLQLPDTLKGIFTIVCSYIGYYDQTQTIRLPFTGKRTIDFRLKESRLYMDQIVVTGTRGERFLKDTPVTTQVIRSKDIQQSGSNDVADVLLEMTGIDIEQHERFGSVTDLQGFDSNHILFLVDGTKQIGRLNGQFDISQIPASDIERIEVVKGPASAIYGSQAMGGVINIITRRPESHAQLGSTVKIGSYGRLNANLSAEIPIASWSSKLFLDMNRFGGYDLDASTPKQDGRSYNKYNGRLQIKGRAFTRLQLETEVNHFQEEQNRVLDAVFAEKIRNRRSGLKFIAKMDSVAGFKIKTTLDYSRYRHEYFDVVRRSGYLKAGDPTDNGFLFADILLSRRSGRHNMEGGYSYEGESITSRRVAGTTRRSNLQSLYFQDEISLFTKTKLLAGGRFDAHDIYGQQFSPKLSVMFFPGRTSRIRLGYGHGFRAPAFKELFLDFFVSDVNLTIVGNPNLTPEVSDGFNLDYEFWNSDDYHVRLNFFYNRVKDLISDIRIPGAGLVYTYHNFEQVRTWGGEWDMAYFPLDWLQLKMGYSYTDSRVKSTGKALAGKMHHKGQAGILLTLPYDVKLNLRALFFGPRVDSEIDEASGELHTGIKIPGYVLYNLNVDYDLPYHIRLQAGARNLTNYVKEFWGPMPGREWYFGLSYRLK